MKITPQANDKPTILHKVTSATCLQLAVKYEFGDLLILVAEE